MQKKNTLTFIYMDIIKSSIIPNDSKMTMSGGDQWNQSTNLMIEWPAHTNNNSKYYQTVGYRFTNRLYSKSIATTRTRCKYTHTHAHPNACIYIYIICSMYAYMYCTYVGYQSLSFVVFTFVLWLIFDVTIELYWR